MGGRAISRVLFARRNGQMVISLGWLSPATSRGLPAAQATRAGSRCLFGLAPTGGYRAAPVTRRAVGSYPTVSPLPLDKGRFVFCGPLRRLAAPRRYLAVCPRELGLSSAHRSSWHAATIAPFRHPVPNVPALEGSGQGSSLEWGAERPREDSRRGLSGRPEGRPRLKRVLKDAGAPPSFRTDLQPRPGFSPCDHPSQPLNDVFQHRASARAAGPAGPACRKQARSLVFPCRSLPPPDRPRHPLRHEAKSRRPPRT